MKCCVSTDVGTWTNWLTFEPDLDHSPDAGTRLLSPMSYTLRNFAALPTLPTSCAATRNFTSGKSPRIRIGSASLERAVVLKWFYSLSRRKTFVGGKCALPSALLVSLREYIYSYRCRCEAFIRLTGHSDTSTVTLNSCCWISQLYSSTSSGAWGKIWSVWR